MEYQDVKQYQTLKRKAGIDRGGIKKRPSEGYIFNAGYGRSQREVSAQLVELERPELSSLQINLNNLNITMENGLNFEKLLRLLRQAESGKSRMERSRNNCIHSSCITISCYYSVAKEYWGEGNFVLSHIGS
jgi:hypothetical protein